MTLPKVERDKLMFLLSSNASPESLLMPAERNKKHEGKATPDELRKVRTLQYKCHFLSQIDDSRIFSPILRETFDFFTAAAKSFFSLLF